MKNLKKIKSLNCLMVLALLMSTMHCGNAQQKDKIKLYSISIGLGYFGFDSPDSGYVTYGNASAKKNNLNLNGDLVFELDNYLFSFYFSTSLVKSTPFLTQNAFSEYNLTVGKSFLNKKWFAIEGHLGVGYFEEREQYATNGPTISYDTMGFPIRLKVNFYLSKYVALGINPNVNFNFGGPSIMSINLISQIRL